MRVEVGKTVDRGELWVKYWGDVSGFGVSDGKPEWSHTAQNESEIKQIQGALIVGEWEFMEKDQKNQCRRDTSITAV